MSSHTTFPVKEINRLRKEAAKAARPPTFCPEGWSTSIVDPMGVLAVFEPLRIKEGHILRAYQFREGENGNGFVWAVPVDADFPHPKECPRLQDVFLGPPKPPLALDDLMGAIDGDESPWSYMCALIFRREIAEFGAMWHGCDWATHGILDKDPWRDGRDSQYGDVIRLRTPESEWEWLQPKPTDWRPQVVQDGDHVTVSFLTFSELGRETIFRHMDVYSADNYKFKADRQEVAKGIMGVVF